METEKKIILLVDDNPTNLKLGIHVLENKFNLYTSPSAQKMFSLLENINPAMILLDVDMPDMNGYETIKILKSKPETRNIPVIFLTGRTEFDDELEGLNLGAIDYITKPFQPLLLLKRIEVHLLVETQKNIMEKQASNLINFSENLQKMVWQKTQDVMDLQNALLKTMAEMVECRDHVTGGHIERTQQGIKILLNEIKRNGFFNEETTNWDTEILLQSSQLHDVGKISISDVILKKPGKLDNNEFEEMKKHVVSGEQIITKIESLAKQSDFLKYAKLFISGHHEKWDGSGYPRGLKGNEIPLLGRIMAIADVYDALISVRPYKNAYSHEEAVQIITKGRGSQFDPHLVDVFIRISDQFKNAQEKTNKKA